MTTKAARSTLLLASLLVATTPETVDNFITREVNNRTYLLSVDIANFSQARQNCSKVGATLVLFKTETEYRHVLQDLTTYIANTNLPVRGIWLDLNVTRTSKGLSVRWRDEQVGDQVWHTDDPNENCVAQSQVTCCARVDRTAKSEFYLRDAQCQMMFRYLCVADDECSEGTHNCSHTCIERANGYHCGCSTGYVLGNDSWTCEDLDECNSGREHGSNNIEHGCNNSSHDCKHGCENSSHGCEHSCKNSSHGCEQGCTNTAGSYVCTCKSGYALSSDGRSCDDVNECLSDNKRCNHTCTNTNGSYVCSCEPGYHLAGDNQTCVNTDECVRTPAPCQHGCNDTHGSFTCFCHAGYRLQPDGSSCADVDECKHRPPVCEHHCTNNNGSFSCTCRSGFTIQADGRSCLNEHFNRCPCSCVSRSRLTRNSLDLLVDTIKREMKVNPQNLTSARAKRMSAPDDRVTSQTLGYSGVALISVLVGCVVLVDALAVLVWLFFALYNSG